LGKFVAVAVKRNDYQRFHEQFGKLGVHRELLNPRVIKKNLDKKRSETLPRSPGSGTATRRSTSSLAIASSSASKAGEELRPTLTERKKRAAADKSKALRVARAALLATLALVASRHVADHAALVQRALLASVLAVASERLVLLSSLLRMIDRDLCKYLFSSA